MADIFATLKYHRKQSFFLRHAFLSVYPSLVQSSAKREQTLLNDNLNTMQGFLMKICNGYNVKGIEFIIIVCLIYLILLFV